MHQVHKTYKNTEAVILNVKNEADRYLMRTNPFEKYPRSPPSRRSISPDAKSDNSQTIGLFKMFSLWIWGIFNIQIQSDRGHNLMLSNHGFHIHQGLWRPWTATDRDLVPFEPQ